MMKMHVYALGNAVVMACNVMMKLCHSYEGETRNVHFLFSWDFIIFMQVFMSFECDFEVDERTSACMRIINFMMPICMMSTKDLAR